MTRTGPKRPASLVALLCALALVGTVGLWPSHVEAVFSTQILAVVRLFAVNPATAWITYPVIESVANVLLFVPLGFLLARVLGARWGWIAGPAAIILSAALEVAQFALLTDRTSDLRDVLANGAGAVLGAVLGVMSVKGESPASRDETAQPEL